MLNGSVVMNDDGAFCTECKDQNDSKSACDVEQSTSDDDDDDERATEM